MPWLQVRLLGRMVLMLAPYVTAFDPGNLHHIGLLMPDKLLALTTLMIPKQPILMPRLLH
jgi:hypothetical protein